MEVTMDTIRYIGLDELVHYRVDCWCLRSWCSGNGVDADTEQ